MSHGMPVHCRMLLVTRDHHERDESRAPEQQHLVAIGQVNGNERKRRGNPRVSIE